ncbi:hypothetical protein D9V84_10785 [Bacteroidetes/Chlorobi group bacterium Naka2016]|jgi:hypothetical protein|nr:MAG: hypothetical protein D9V84_10785 [Bacteroidetes/Chlorobi group bacterium Naka2016]
MEEKMKHIISIILLLVLFYSSYSQKQEKAPFGGKIIAGNKSTILILERSDGSEITRFPSGEWYLTKESTSNSPKPIPSWVKKVKPVKIIYTNSSGHEYFTFDGYNWEMNAKPTTTNLFNKQNVEIKKSALLVENTLILKPRVQQTGVYQLTITNLHGNVVYCETREIGPEMNQIAVDIGNLSSGTYFYHLSNGIINFTGLFVKY